MSVLPNLPKGFKWSYIFPPNKKIKKPFWFACAIKYLNRQKFVRDVGTCGLFNEIYATGKTRKEAVDKVIKRIKFEKRLPRRYICFSFED